MISRSVLGLVVIVSCAHALVHVFEHALPSVEQQIAQELSPNDTAAGMRMTGLLSTSWRLPWGLGALVAGWLVDRFGAQRMLALFLWGSAVCYVFVSTTHLSFGGLTAAMIVMGSLAAIYHPAGLSLISHRTDPQNRPWALGVHGVLGSLGTGLPLFLVGGLLDWGFGWRTYYALLAVPGLALGAYFAWRGVREDPAAATAAKTAGGDTTHWPSFFLLTILAMLQGFVYSAVVSFLPRYLGAGPYGSEGNPADGAADSPDGTGAMLAGGVLLLGCVGQYLAGSLARPKRLEIQLTCVTLANVPFLLWMGIADDWRRFLAAGLFALIHYMHQPLYNSLVAKYTPSRRRSLCYGFSFAMGLGIGGLGAAFTGWLASQQQTYLTLGGVALVSSLLGTALWLLNRNDRAQE